MIMQTELTFYRDPANPLIGTKPSSTWQCCGNALSASSVRIYPSKTTVISATWFLVWDPNAGIGFNAVRLVSADDGPANLQQVAFINRNNCAKPHVDTADVTDVVRAIAAGDTSKQLIMQTCGDTESKIYRSTIDIVWGL